MGLDITAYSKLECVGSHVEGWCEDEDHIKAFAYDNFPQSFRGIPVLRQGNLGRVFDSTAILVGGCYTATDATERYDFEAGSYIGYNQWRADLQRQFNPDRVPDESFYELIWFADNEGSIGPAAARDLLADFEEHATQYNPGGEYAEYARQKYADWTRACALAADAGLIRFH